MTGLALGIARARLHHRVMRLPWDRNKPPQLDLLGLDAPANEATATAVDESPVPHVLVHAPMPSTTVAESSTTDQALPAQPESSASLHGEPLQVALSALFEDADNPRTEFPEAELQALADDIRQHGILQPIVVHPAQADGRHRIHFGAKRLRAARMAGLDVVPVVVRDAAADPYAQVAENQQRNGLTPLDLARFIHARSALGESNATIARRLGMDLTSIAHHLALLDLPAPLAAALRSGRCAAPRTLYELSKLHARYPQNVTRLLDGDQPITREAVAALRPRMKRSAGRAGARSASRPGSAERSGTHPKPTTAPPSAGDIAMRAQRQCAQLQATCRRLRDAGFDQVPADAMAALREQLRAIGTLLDA